MNQETVIKIYVGDFLEFNREEYDTFVESYKPYIKEFSTVYSFLKWASTADKPLLADKFLSIINLKMRYNEFMVQYLKLKDFQSDITDLVITVSPKDKFHSLPPEIRNLSATLYQDFKSYIADDLNITEYLANKIIKNIGLSYYKYTIYREDLYSNKPLTVTKINKVIVDRRTATPQFILEGIINGNKSAVKEYYKLAEKYSERWLNDHFLELIDATLKAWNELYNTDKKIYEYRELPSYNLIKSADLRQLIMLKNCLKQFKTIESYLLSRKTQSGWNILKESDKDEIK